MVFIASVSKSDVSSHRSLFDQNASLARQPPDACHREISGRRPDSKRKNSFAPTGATNNGILTSHQEASDGKGRVSQSTAVRGYVHAPRQPPRVRVGAFALEGHLQ